MFINRSLQSCIFLSSCLGRWVGKLCDHGSGTSTGKGGDRTAVGDRVTTAALILDGTVGREHCTNICREEEEQQYREKKMFISIIPNNDMQHEYLFLEIVESKYFQNEYFGKQ